MVKIHKGRGRPCSAIGLILQYFNSPKKKDSRSLNQKLTNSFYHQFYNMLKLNVNKDTYDLYSSRFWPKSFLNKDEVKVFTRKEKPYFNIWISQNLRAFYKTTFNEMVDKFAKILIQTSNEKQLEKIFNCKLDSRFEEKAPIREKIWEGLILHHLANIGKDSEETKESQKFIIDISNEAEKYIQLQSSEETKECQKFIVEHSNEDIKLNSEHINNNERPYLNEISDEEYIQSCSNSTYNLDEYYDYLQVFN